MPEKFVVPYGQLSPQGIRQRYLLGKYGRQRYVEVFGALNQHNTPQQNDMYVQSTDFYRTIQSAYAQLYGYLHADIGTQLAESNSSSSKSSLLMLNKNQ